MEFSTNSRSTPARIAFLSTMLVLSSFCWIFNATAATPSIHQHAFEDRPFAEVSLALQSQIKQSNDQQPRIDLQFSLAALYFQYDRVDLLPGLIDQIVLTSSGEQTPEHRVLLAFYRAYTYSSQGQYESAENFYRTGRELLDQSDIIFESGQEYVANVFEMYTAVNSAFLQEYSSAIQTLSALKVRADERDWLFLSALALYWLGDVNYELKNYEQAELYFRQSKQAYPKAAQHFRAKSQVREAQMTNIVGERDQAFALLNDATEQLDKFGDISTLAYTYLLQSYFHSKNLNHEVALYWIAKSVSLREKLGKKGDIANAYVHYSAILAENNQPLKALDYAQRSAILVAETEDLAGQWDAYNNYGHQLYAQGDYKLAYEYMSKSERALLAKARLDITQETARLINQFEFQQQSLSNQFLDEKNTLLQKQLSQEQAMLKRQSQTITALSVFVILIILLLALIYKLYRNNKKLAIKDPLTSLPNRRTILEDGDRAFAISKRYNQNLCVLMVDIDNFKSINDSYGHDVGDQALIFVASIFNKVLRTTDCVGRVGGEEFLIVLPNCTEDQALHLVKRLFIELQESLESSKLVLDKLTVSIGLALNKPEYNSFIALAKSADVALYNAKQKGRNQVQVFTEGMVQNPISE